MKLFILVSLFLTYFQTVSAKPNKIVSGSWPKPPHPALYNTIALVKADGSIYCTASLIGPKLAVTAKHCLVDRDPKDVNLFFGDSIHKEGVTIPVTDYQVRHPLDWTMMFPSFDIAWVKFEETIPEGYRPLPILTNRNLLSEGMDVYQAGFGNHSATPGRIEAGDRLVGMTRLGGYINNSRFFNILLFQGDRGQGSCHGDSGGPAYVKIAGQWFIIGVTNGFDVVLTPDAMLRTTDPDFPYNITCSENQSLYSFIGAHGKWIERTSKEQVWKSSPFQDLDREVSKEEQSLMAWCQARDFGSPSWNLLKVLIDKRVDQLPQSQGRAFYNDCNEIVDYLKSVKSIYLNYNSTPEGHINFSSAKLLSSLERIAIYEYPLDQVDLSTLKDVSLKELRLINLNLETLPFKGELSVENLILDKNPLVSLKGIEKIKNLKSLSLTGTTLKTLEDLRGINLEELSLVGMNTSILLGLENIYKGLQKLDLRDTYIPETGIIKNFTDLIELRLTGTSGEVDLSKNKKLVKLFLNEFKNGQVTFPKEMPLLESFQFTNSDVDSINFLKGSPLLKEAVLTYNRIQDLSVFASAPFKNLSSVNLSVNPILDVSPLIGLDNLSILRLFRTPLESNLVPRNEDNCPTTIGPLALRKFCSN